MGQGREKPSCVCVSTSRHERAHNMRGETTKLAENIRAEYVAE